MLESFVNQTGITIFDRVTKIRFHSSAVVSEKDLRAFKVLSQVKHNDWRYSSYARTESEKWEAIDDDLTKNIKRIYSDCQLTLVDHPKDSATTLTIDRRTICDSSSHELPANRQKSPLDR